MTVTVTWSLTTGSVTELEHEEIGSGETTSGIQVWISHDGNKPITNCRFYLDPVAAGDYTGDDSAQGNYNTLLGWGNQTTSGYFGGIFLNMDAENDFPDTSWPTYDDKYGDNYSVFMGARGDVVESGIYLSEAMSAEMTVAGVIPADMTEWPSFCTRVHIPASGVNTAELVQVLQKMRYTFTS